MLPNSNYNSSSSEWHPRPMGHMDTLATTPVLLPMRLGQGCRVDSRMAPGPVRQSMEVIPDPRDITMVQSGQGPVVMSSQVRLMRRTTPLRGLQVLDRRRHKHRALMDMRCRHKAKDKDRGKGGRCGSGHQSRHGHDISQCSSSKYSYIVHCIS
jgi:hypothetical protein